MYAGLNFTLNVKTGVTGSDVEITDNDKKLYNQMERCLQKALTVMWDFKQMNIKVPERRWFQRKQRWMIAVDQDQDMAWSIAGDEEKIINTWKSK